jgi:hypothetical protein
MAPRGKRERGSGKTTPTSAKPPAPANTRTSRNPKRTRQASSERVVSQDVGSNSFERDIREEDRARGTTLVPLSGERQAEDEEDDAREESPVSDNVPTGATVAAPDALEPSTSKGVALSRFEKQAPELITKQLGYVCLISQ